MNSQQHIIRQQTIAIEIAKAKDAMAIQDAVKQVYYNKILPKLDVLFSSMVSNETIIRIEKLDIDIGSLEKDKLEQQLFEKTINSIEAQLKEKLQFDVNGSSDVSIISTQQAVIDEFIYFLLHGYFSWRSPIKEISSLEKALISENISNAMLAGEIDKLLKDNSFVAERLVYQFSDELLHFLSQGYAPHFSAKNTLAIIQAALAGNHFEEKNAVRNHFWKVVFKNRSLATSNTEFHVFLETFAFVASRQNTSVKAVLQSIDKTKIAADILAQLENVLESKIDENTSTINASLKDNLSNHSEEDNIVTKESSAVNIVDIPEIDTSKQYAQTNSNTAGSSNAGTTEQSSINQKYTTNSIAADEPIYIELAGLVILHHFLIPFFDTLRLIENKKFRSEEALHKAVQLTGYLATGTTETEETFLVLPKLLCGMELTAVVQNNITISEEEKQEADTLLRQVTEHWSALKNTSPDGLRNTFLQREGMLKRCGLGWQLDIEHKTWDILLTKLPWGYSFIKLPWMKECLFVNWA